MNNDLNELMKLANDGNKDAINKLIQHFEEQGDEENVEYFKDLLNKTNEAPEEQEKEEVPNSNIVSDNRSLEEIENWIYHASNENLLERVTFDPVACYGLGNSSFNNDKYVEAVNYYEQAIKLFETKEKKSDAEKAILCRSFIGLAVSLNNYKGFLGTNDVALNLQNALEIDCDDKEKSDAYTILSWWYRKGLVVEENIEKAGEYFIKGNSHTARGCLTIAKLVWDERKPNNRKNCKEWLENAKKIIQNSDNHEDEYLNDFIDMELAVIVGKETVDDIIDGLRFLYRKKEDVEFLNDYSKNAIINKLIDSVSYTNSDINEHNNHLFLSCLGACLAFKTYNDEIIDFVKNYLILSKDHNDIDNELKDATPFYLEFYDFLVAVKNHANTLKWFEEFVNDNVWLKNDNKMYDLCRNKLEEERQIQKEIDEKNARIEAERKALEEKKRLEALEEQRRLEALEEQRRLEEIEKQRCLQLIEDKAKEECEEIEKILYRRQEEKTKQQKKIGGEIKQSSEGDSKGYTSFCIKIIIVVVVSSILANTEFISGFWSTIRSLSVVTWLFVSFFTGVNGFKPFFAKKTIEIIKEQISESIALNSSKEKDEVVDFEIEIHSDHHTYSGSVTQKLPAYFGKYENFGYIKDSSYTTKEFYGSTLKDKEQEFFSIKIRGYKTVFKGTRYKDMYFINASGDEIAEFAEAAEGYKIPKNADLFLQIDSYKIRA